MNAIVRVAWLLGSVLVVCTIVLLWQAVADAQLVSPVFLPVPGKVWGALVSGFTEGKTLSLLGATASRVFGGWILASLVGVALGAAIGVSSNLRAYIAPSLEALRPLPVSALVPIFIGILGFTEQMVVVIIAFGALWPTLLNTVHGFSAVEPRLYEVAKTLRLSRLKIIWTIALPSALPDIMAGLRVGLTVSLILVVVGEILGNRDGLGYAILLAQRAYQPADLLAGIILLGLMGYVSTTCLDAIESRLIYWR